MKNFWQQLNKPIFALAPLEDVTDTVFRRIVASCGRPDVFFTEFTNVDGLLSEYGSKAVAKRLIFTEEERPIIAQIWGEKPENFYTVTKNLIEMGFDGVDINMGCPERSVLKKGLCAGLMNNKPLAKEIIQATKKATGNTLPISIKTRIGFKTIETEEWISFLLEQGLDALIVHGRTVKEMSQVPAHWDEIGKIVQLRDKIYPQTIIIGNGDVESISEAKEKVEKYKVDGVMIGRGIFKDPWLFNQDNNSENITLKEKIDKLVEHVELFESTWGEKKHFPIMKKFFKCYINGFEKASEIRLRLMECNNGKDVIEALFELKLFNASHA